ncbi:methionine synthase reductase-like isoform X2 [Anopheles coustani]|uniref:methionine synthase reductase-like isoform X2 n=1 Tax=Anopheles coustani TaxID=139045 RepID=UPI002658A5A1|nr:methionine synthase reductase-like isoform X2 [Anopheles coustani]
MRRGELRHLQANAPQPFAATKVLDGFISNLKPVLEGEDVKTVYDVTLNYFQDALHRHWPGDTIGILTYNLPADVYYVLNRLDLEGKVDAIHRVGIDKNCTKKAAKVPPFVPAAVSLRRLFSECLDLRAVPKKSLIRALIPCTSDPCEKRFLEVLCSKEGHSVYEEYILKQGKGFTSLLKLVASCKPTTAIMIEHLPRLMPRPYSIANAHREDGKPTIRFIFSHNASRPGITTTYLRGLDTSALVYFYFRQSSAFTIKDSELQNDLIMVGTGTGVSPYLAFLDLRAEALAKGQTIGKAELIAGFRYRDRSYLCQEEILGYVETGVLDACYEAFSRDENSRFKYVQDRIKERKAQIVENLRSPHGLFFVCGDSKVLLPQITATIVELLAESSEDPERESSKAFIDQLKKDGKYREDVWL